VQEWHKTRTLHPCHSTWAAFPPETSAFHTFVFRVSPSSWLMWVESHPPSSLCITNLIHSNIWYHQQSICLDAGACCCILTHLEPSNAAVMRQRWYSSDQLLCAQHSTAQLEHRLCDKVMNNVNNLHGPLTCGLPAWSAVLTCRHPLPLPAASSCAVLAR